MQKYNIMIADDEVDVREGIAAHIDWAALGFEIAAVAENGLDALEQAESVKIDVVLTDIKMPFMDGLSMSAKLSQMYPDVKIIILSGFDEFEYAKKAIKLNVIEYVLKPINASELTEVLLRVRRLLDESIEQKRNIDALRESYEKSLPVMRERFLNDLLWGTVPYDNINHQLNIYNLPIDQSPHQIVTVFETDMNAKKSPLISSELAPVSIIQIIDEQFAGHCKSTVFINSPVIVAITAWENPNPIAELMSIVNEICSKCARALELRLTAGIGHCYNSVDKIHNSFLEARSALEYKAVAGAGKAIYIDDMERNRIDITAFENRSEERLFSAVKFGSRDQISMLITDIFDEMNVFKEWERQAYIFNLLNGVYRIIRRYELYNDDSVMSRLDSFINTSNERTDENVMREEFLELCVCMSEHIISKRERAAYNLAEEAKRFIDLNYQNSDLSVERLCEHLHVSQSYFSTIFRQETGISYVQYLTELRMSRATELLQQTDDKTYTIADKIGYDDPNYFSYVFKRRFGISPAKYRKQTER